MRTRAKEAFHGWQCGDTVAWNRAISPTRKGINTVGMAFSSLVLLRLQAEWTAGTKITKISIEVRVGQGKNIKPISPGGCSWQSPRHAAINEFRTLIHQQRQKSLIMINPDREEKKKNS